MEPIVHHFRGGWSVSGDGCAAFAGTREEALRQYRQLIGEPCSVADCPRPAALSAGDRRVCVAHFGEAQVQRAFVEPGAPIRDLLPQ